MRVAIDIRRIHEFGVGAHIWNLVANISRADKDTEYFLCGSRRQFLEFGPLGANFRPLHIPGEESHWNDHARLPFLLRKHGIDVFHVPHHGAPLLVPCRLVVTIHDCVHLLFPQQGSSKFDNYRRYLLTRHVVRGADRIVAVSQFTRKDLLNIFDPAPEKIVVVPNALDDRFEARHDSDYQKAVLERYQLTDPFILYAGQIKPHKNVDRLIEAFAVLKSELGNNKHYRNLKLIVIGDQISLHPYLRLTAIRSGVQRDIRFFGFVPHPTLQVFYEAAVIFASPSLYEGFALTALEAMANGTPVVASNTSAFPEVLEDAALLVNPENVFEIAKALKLFLIDQVRRQEAVEKGLKQVRKFSWTRSANQVVDVYRSLADRGTPPAAVTGADSKAKAKASADAG